MNGKMESDSKITLKIPLEGVSADVNAGQNNTIGGDYKVHDRHEEVVKICRFCLVSVSPKVSAKLVCRNCLIS